MLRGLKACFGLALLSGREKPWLLVRDGGTLAPQSEGIAIVAAGSREQGESALAKEN